MYLALKRLRRNNGGSDDDENHGGLEIENLYLLKGFQNIVRMVKTMS